MITLNTDDIINAHLIIFLLLIQLVIQSTSCLVLGRTFGLADRNVLLLDRSHPRERP